MTADLIPVDPAPGPRAGGISVRGGVGSIRFQWEELQRGALQLELLADELREILHQCGELQWQLQMLLKRQDRGVDSSGVAAVAALDEARRAVARNAGGLRDAAERLTTCRLTYEAAEAVARVATFVPRTTVDAVERDLHRIIERANASDLMEPAPVSVHRVSPTAALTVDGSVPALLQRVEEVTADGPGVFEVLKVHGPGGDVFVVVLPGTQGTTATATGNPFDPTGIVEAVRYDSTFVADAVQSALAESGAAPGDRVMVVGYSQGGMHAANLAQHSPVSEDYRVELVLTAGSPTGRELSGSSQYLHLEHEDDWVHQVDGTLNPDERNRVTVMLEGPAAEVPTEEKGLGAAHKLDTYVAGAEAVDASAHPSLVASVGVLRAAIGTVSPAERNVFRAQRSSPEGKHAPVPAPGKQPRLRSVSAPPPGR